MLTGGPRASLKRFDLGMLRGQRVRYLLDVTWAGRTFRLSTEDVRVTCTEAGEEYAYAGDLVDPPELEEALDLFSASAEVVAVPLTFTLPVDVPLLISQGYDLLQALGELSLWIEGTTYEDRRVVLRGPLVDPEYGWAGEPVSASLQSAFFDDLAIIPDPALVVTAEAWPNMADAADGAAYPEVYGLDDSDGVTLSRAYLVDTVAEVVLIAGHACGVGAVWINCDSDTTGVAATMATTTDALGRVVTVADLTGLGLLYNVGDSFYVRFSEGAGGLVERSGTTALSGAGDVLEYLLSRSSLTVDYGRVAAAKPYLNRYKLGGCILEGVSPWEYVTANLCPILPMSVVTGPWGVYVVPWRYDATAADAVEHLDVGADPTLEQDGPVSYTMGAADVVNRFTLRYNLSQRVGDTFGQVLMSGREEAPSDALSNVYCRQSLLRYGERSAEEESTVIREAATAGLVVSWWAQARALPARIVRYTASYDRAWLERGNVVSLTDPNLHLSAHVALVVGIAYREADLMITLRLVDNVASQFHGAT